MALSAAGLLRNWKGDYDDAAHLQDKGLLLAEEGGLLLPLLFSCFLRGLTLTGKGDYDDAFSAFTQGLTLAQRVGGAVDVAHREREQRAHGPDRPVVATEPSCERNTQSNRFTAPAHRSTEGPVHEAIAAALAGAGWYLAGLCAWNRECLGSLQGAVDRMGSGDLSLAVETRYDAAVGQVRSAIEQTCANLAHIVEQVHRGQVRAKNVSGDITVGVPDGVPVWTDLSTVTGTLSSNLAGAGEPRPEPTYTCASCHRHHRPTPATPAFKATSSLEPTYVTLLLS